MSESKLHALFAGSFDPVTRGHVDLIERASRMFASLRVGVAHNASKTSCFSVEERLDLLCAEISHLDHVIVESFEGLVVEHCQAHGVSVLVRGVRTASDFEYEASMAQTNYLLDSSIETMFLMPSEEYTFLSSRLVREVYAAGGSLPRFVSPRVDERLIHKLRK